jgi:small subunit ribosomal protein S6
LASDKPRDYELVVILSPEASEAEMDVANQGTASFITERGGSVGDTDSWGLRRLAYPIKKFQEGNYAVTRFTLDPQGAHDLGQTLETSEQVLRHLIVKV